MPEKHYITSTIPYVNAAPHLGFALELVLADALARSWRARGEEVRFVSGTDDNALKNVLAAEKAGVPVRKFVAEKSKEFRALREVLNISWDDFISTSEERHVRGVQKFWQACRKEDIYKKKYAGLYCVGCESFKTEKELVSGKCPEHPATALERIEEENYFFRLSAYGEKLERLIASGELRIVPESRKNEILKFIGGGLQDFSISRSVARAKGWGIPVPGDQSQVIYVWFDALTNYLNALGYADNDALFQKFWAENDQIVHVLGKDVIRFHAVYWPAMLLSAVVRLPKTIFVHGFLTIDGQKISKSLGNVIHPREVADKYGLDAVRYYLLREISPFEDGDFSYAKFEERYNADLANGLGNFAARVLTLAEKQGAIEIQKPSAEAARAIAETKAAVAKKSEEYKFNEALASVWELIAFGDRYVNEKKPWDKALETKNKAQIISDLLQVLENTAAFLVPFLPETAEKIQKAIGQSGKTAKARNPGIIFPRKN